VVGGGTALTTAEELELCPMRMPKPATLGSEELLGYGLRRRKLLMLAETLSTA
jgi:hypothetical protein